jgi:hypothetical protein
VGDGIRSRDSVCGRLLTIVRLAVGGHEPSMISTTATRRRSLPATGMPDRQSIVNRGPHKVVDALTPPVFGPNSATERSTRRGCGRRVSGAQHTDHGVAPRDGRIRLATAPSRVDASDSSRRHGTRRARPGRRPWVM